LIESCDVPVVWAVRLLREAAEKMASPNATIFVVLDGSHNSGRSALGNLGRG
jgi:hypothetical protein